jgi:hypothetical protein
MKDRQSKGVANAGGDSIKNSLGFVILSLSLFITVKGQTIYDQELARAEARAKTQGTTNLAHLLADPSSKRTTWFLDEGEGSNLTCNGQPLAEVLRNKESLGTKQISLNDLFTLKPIITGREPIQITYELPISYDALRKIKPTVLQLTLDSTLGNEQIFTPDFQSCDRATNGDCLLTWDALDESPGQHALQAFLYLFDFGGHRRFYVKGPVIPYFSSNLFQYNGMWFTARLVYFEAKLPESNGVFNIEFKNQSGKHIKTLAGSTSNGTFKVTWNLIDDKNRRYTNNVLNLGVTVELPASGRYQTLELRCRR